MLRPQIDEIAEAQECPMLTFDGLDDAVIGYGSQAAKDPCFIYDYDKIVAILVDRDGMHPEEAEEYAEYNIISAYLGEGTPIVVRTS